MDDPDFSVSLVKLESSSVAEEEMQNTSSSWIGGSNVSKDCHLLWDALRKQGQLFKVLDTLTNKTARLIGRLQNQTATEEDSDVAVQLLSQLGVLFVDMETNEDGTKEKRYTFVTDVDATGPRQISKNEPIQEVVPAQPVSLVTSGTDAYTTDGQRESDDDIVDGFEPDYGSEKVNTTNEEEEVPKATYICSWCNEDLGTPVMLDLHKLRYCEIMKKSRIRNRCLICPTCSVKFKQQARLYNHLLEDHSTEASEAMKILHDLETKKPEDPPEENIPTPKKDKDESVASEIPPKVIKCEICEEYFGNRIALRTHLMEGHDFSRQKAVSSVYESVKLAQLLDQESNKEKKTSGSGQLQCTECKTDFDDVQKLVHHMVSVHDMPQVEAEKTANKQYKELNAAEFACDLCSSKYIVRSNLSKHLVGAHNLSISKVRTKVEKMYPQQAGVEFACDLCSVKCCKRYVLSRHFSIKHGLSKTQILKKTAEMYPLEKSKKSLRVTKNSKILSKEKENALEHTLRNSLKEGKESNKPERTSRRLAQRGKRRNKSKQDKDAEQSNDEEAKDVMSKDEIEEDPKEKQDDQKNKTDDKDNQDEGKDVSDDDIDADEIENNEDDEDYIPSDEDKNPRQNVTDKSSKKRGRPRKNPHPEDDDSIPSGSDNKDTKLRRNNTDKSPKKRGRPRKKPDPEEEDSIPSGSDNGGKKPRQKHAEKSPKKRGRPVWKPDPDGNYKCPQCSKAFQNLYYAKVHMTSVHKDQPAFNCSTCQKPFYFRTTFMRHLICHKNEEMGVKFTCDMCGKSFFDKYTLSTHIKTHTMDKPFKCDFCDKGFFHKSLLVRHRNLHTKDVEYKCSMCDRVFYRKGGLKYHILSVHENKRDFVCTHCGQGFASKSSLIAHEQSHSSNRPFQCDICGTRVKTKGNLKEHMMCVHTDKRDFKCEICQKTFNRSHRLTLHMMMHRDERPHKCHLCDKAFRTRTNLRVHVKWHQDQRDFQCEQCGKTFLIPGNLDRHMQTHKNEKTTKRKLAKKHQWKTANLNCRMLTLHSSQW